VGVLIAVLLLLLLLRSCPAEEPAAPEVPVVVAPAVVPAPPPAPLPPPAPTGRVATRGRPSFETPVPAPLPWVSSFRMQVAARSPRLAECFVGADRPGKLKWTASVSPVDGRVSEHVLEPMLVTDAISGEQRACVLGVLSDPPYRLDDDGRTTPSRVGVVIEF
jgi:hypothetical protein